MITVRSWTEPSACWKYITYLHNSYAMVLTPLTGEKQSVEDVLFLNVDIFYDKSLVCVPSEFLLSIKVNYWTAGGERRGEGGDCSDSTTAGVAR